MFRPSEDNIREDSHNLFMEFIEQRNKVCICNYVASPVELMLPRIDHHQPQLTLLIYEFLAGRQSRD